MGLFSSVLHIYERSQSECVTALSAELKERLGNCQISKIEPDESHTESFPDEIDAEEGCLYLVTAQHGAWATINQV